MEVDPRSPGHSSPFKHRVRVHFPGVVAERRRSRVSGSRIDIEYDTHYSCDGRAISETFATALAERDLDFLNIGAAVYAADRLSPRRCRGGDPYAVRWQRIMELEVPVQDFRFWEESGVRTELERAIAFVAGDVQWTLRFTKAGKQQRRGAPHPKLWPTEGQTCLFSGGLDPGLTGTLTPRPMHPVFLGLLENVVTRMHGTPFRLDLPYVFETKTQLLQGLTRNGLDQVVADTISCAHYRHQECGLCTGCLLRRQAMTLAGLSELDLRKAPQYGIDILGPDSSAWTHHRRAWLMKATLLQVSRLKAVLDTGEAWCHLEDLDPDMGRAAAMLAARDGRPEMEVRDEIVQMYRRYADEWYRFAQYARDTLEKQAVLDWPTLLLGEN